MPDVESFGIPDVDLEKIVRKIKQDRCVPFIGPGLCKKYYRGKSAIAQAWADSLQYPFPDRTDFARVAQFQNVHAEDEQASRYLLVDEFVNSLAPRNFDDNDEAHRVLADMPFKVYITTNYDNCMFQALQKARKDPRRDYSRWKGELEGAPQGGREITIANPVVFHLYGHVDKPETLVVTETDYMRFLLRAVKSREVIPPHIQECLVPKTLLFLGYQLDDWDTRILLTVLNGLFPGEGLRETSHVSIQVDDGDLPPQQRENAQKHFNHYLKNNFNVSVYWGTCEDFTRKLRDGLKD